MTSNIRHTNASASRVRDFLLYIAIGSSFIALILISNRANIARDVFIRWGGLGLNTAILFGYFITKSRLLLRRWSFWGLTGILLGVHLAVFISILTRADEWKLIWFTGMVFEYPAFVFLRNRIAIA